MLDLAATDVRLLAINAESRTIVSLFNLEFSRSEVYRISDTPYQYRVAGRNYAANDGVVDIEFPEHVDALDRQVLALQFHDHKSVWHERFENATGVKLDIFIVFEDDNNNVSAPLNVYSGVSTDRQRTLGQDGPLVTCLLYTSPSPRDS